MHAFTAHYQKYYIETFTYPCTFGNILFLKALSDTFYIMFIVKIHLFEPVLFDQIVLLFLLEDQKIPQITTVFTCTCMYIVICVTTDFLLCKCVVYVCFFVCLFFLVLFLPLYNYLHNFRTNSWLMSRFLVFWSGYVFRFN